MQTQTARELVSLVRDVLQIIVLGVAIFAIISGYRDVTRCNADNQELMQYVKFQNDLNSIPMEIPAVDEIEEE